MINVSLTLFFAHTELIIFLSYIKNKINSYSKTLSLLRNKKNKELNYF
ncbi:hypothetical protein F7308_0598 [Francisella salina]|uniref:Uncharacterized protein n=1 Tax=Francisella salina TaxID=573569 RepID=A0ABM5M8M8_FRAST|nr:hypothetical protein F7308_0598 [Francisella salina]